VIRPLRRTHLRLAIALAVLIPAILVVALAGRRDTPTQAIPAELLEAPGLPQ
jgi:hypothetical protein